MAKVLMLEQARWLGISRALLSDLLAPILTSPPRVGTMIWMLTWKSQQPTSLAPKHTTHTFSPSMLPHLPSSLSSSSHIANLRTRPSGFALVQLFFCPQGHSRAMARGLGEGHYRALCLPRCVEGRRSVRLVAIHHIAANIWPGISPVTSGFDTESVANILRAFLDIAVEVVNEILSFRQDAVVPRLPPKCHL